MTNVTRKFTEYKAVAYNVGEVDGNPSLEVCGDCTYLATSPSVKIARRELKDAGFDIKRGSVIKVSEIATHTYACTLDAFLSVATEIEE